MPGKKAHHPRDPKVLESKTKAPLHPNRKSTGETNGQFENDPGHRKGQYSSSGQPGMTKR